MTLGALRRFMVVLASALVLVAGPSAGAAGQIRPRFMIAFDTSGSMAVDLNNIPTYGDGIAGPTLGIDTDCNGVADDSRIFVAKRALRDMILAFGDIEFGLARFAQLGVSNALCNDSTGGLFTGNQINNQECNTTMGPFVGSLGDPSQNTGAALSLGNCGGEWDGNPLTLETPADIIPAACRPGTGGRPALRRYGAGSPTVCINYVGNCPGATVNLPGMGRFDWPTGDILVGFSGFGWPAGQDNRPGILRWIDNRESAFDASTTPGNYCNHATTGDCELRANGPTPLGGLLRAARDYITPIRSADAVGTCRPYTVTLITDGVEVCQPSTTSPDHPINVARDLFMTSGIPVYVVGLAIGPGNRALLNSIATAGGTDAGGPGGDTAFFADDPDTLSAGLSDIVQRSLLVEVCNDRDDNCNGLIDEGFVKYCNRPAGVTTPTLCVDPGETRCDGMDDNCNGRIDEGLLNACGGCGATPVEVCDGLDNDCDGLIDDGVCGGCAPEIEICDGLDNDCDGLVDEMLTRPCGTDVGECAVGVETCAMGRFSGCTAIGPAPELCDNLDNDCDGAIDNFSEPCGTDVGACSAGARVCIAGTFGACVGAIGPTEEVCNGEDDDCDGTTDEGNPGGGAACGGGTCGMGVITCVMGRLVCEGGGEPASEICDGRDNDCDGEVDEDLPPRGPCGPEVGECLAGREVCRAGAYVCEGGVGPTDEICDGRDNDCDGAVDEGLDGTPCGTDVGECMPGTLRCSDGAMVCSGEVPPSREICDCRDNDCDGDTDEAPAAGSALCPAGSACVACQCALPCGDTEFPCPIGRTCQEFPEGRFCVGSLCDAAACAAMTLERDGEVLCSPTGATRCTCRGNDCGAPCDGITCTEGTICRPSDGRCVENSCRELGCPTAGEVCYHGECQPDRCAMVSCPEACRDGRCVDSCAGISCGSDQRCEDGRCVASGCGGCPIGGQVCNAETGRCVPDACGERTCAGVPGTVCEPATGTCVDDECVVVHCPDGETCSFGSCFGPGDLTGEPRERVLATGGGGLVCAAAPGGGASGAGSGAWLLLLGAALAVLRRRRVRGWLHRRGRVVLALALASSLGAACKVDPYCLNCDDGDGGRRDAGPDGGAREGGTPPGTDGAPADGARTDGCAAGATEECNGVDDDCDGEVDEGFDLSTDPRHCGSCERACTPDNAFPSCTAGVCGVARCDVGYADLDGDPANGCEYACIPSAGDDATCDRTDDDCDGQIDEDADTQGDPRNCGACGIACRFDRAGARCVAGLCELGDCLDGYIDLDGDPENGCEYRCAPLGAEACNGIDDDCDGMVDEGNPGGGEACGGTVGACSPGMRTCMGGALVCVGGTEPTIETCNAIDDDCNGTVDDGYSFATDGNNCGGCGVSCAQPGAVTRCNAGRCERVRCAVGFVDRDGDPTNGCEYACDLLGAEVCNGRDDDCDGMVDEGLTPPANYCNRNGACAGTAASCDGASGWRCHYPAAVETTDADRTMIGTETRCDGVDNDCDGMVDEAFPTVGTECSNGVGACRRVGMFTCNAAGDGVACGAPAAGMPTPETCNDIDDDCDGTVDDADLDGSGTLDDAELRAFGMARVMSGGSTFYVMRWEASRPDASSTASGSSSSHACARSNVVPWTTVTHSQAVNACCALNTGGTCPGGGRGWQLCSGAQWETACRAGSSCRWAYPATCSSSQPTICNGSEFDAYPGPAACTGPGDQDCLTTTGSPLFPMCRVTWDGSDVFDLSGNAKEWTSTARAAGTFEIRGGSFNNLEDGRSCDFDFTVAADSFAFPNTGFRCCYVP